MVLVFVTSWRRVGIVVVLKWGKQKRRVADSYKACWHFSLPSGENSKELWVAKAVLASQDARKWSPVDSEGRVNGLTIRNFLWFMYTKERETVCHWQIARLVRGSRYVSGVLKKRPHDRQGDESVVDSPWRLLKIVALWNIENNYGRMNDEIETSISLIRYLETCCNWEAVQQFLNFRHRCLKFNYITCIKEIKMKATYRKRYIMQRKK